MNARPPASYHHTSARRPNQPTAETAPLLSDEQRAPAPFTVDRREIATPVLAWDRQGRSSRLAGDSTDDAHNFAGTPLYTREKINPLTMIEQLRRSDATVPLSLLDDFNGLPPDAKSWEFYEHAGHWQNRLIHGDSSEVMQSLIVRDGLGGRVQMIYFDPPYGMGFKSNFMTGTDRMETKDDITGVPVGDASPLRAFRDTYRNGIDSYLDTVHERLVLARELLTNSGSLFLQIGDKNVHRLAVLCDEVFGADNRVATITWKPTSASSSATLPEVASYLLWYAKDKQQLKYRQLYEKLSRKEIIEHFSSYVMYELSDGSTHKLTPEQRSNPDKHLPPDARLYKRTFLASQGTSTTGRSEPYRWQGQVWPCHSGWQWQVSMDGLDRLAELGRLDAAGSDATLRWKQFEDEIPGRKINNVWQQQMSLSDKRYVVQTATSVIERCINMTTDPGDLVLDPTCGSGVTAEVCERWGRRWITIDSSRVAIAIARRHLITRIYPWWSTLDGGSDPSAGFETEVIQRTSAATLAYGTVHDSENTILLVDQPAMDRKRRRLTGPFTIESSSPYTYLPFGDPNAPSDRIGAAVGDEAATLLEALTANPISDTEGYPRLQVVELEAWPEGILATQEARCQIPGRDTEVTVAVMLGAPDVTITGQQATQAATEARRNRSDIEDLVVVAYAYDPDVPTSAGLVQIHKVVAPRDLQIPELARQSDAGALTMLGEPDVTLEPGLDGNLIVELRGYDTYNPTTGRVEPSYGSDVDCWMIDTDHDRSSFFPRLVYLPGAKRRSDLADLLKTLGNDLDPDAERALTGLRSQPFPPPAPGNTVAVKIITRTGAEMTTTIQPNPTESTLNSEPMRHRTRDANTQA